MTGFFFSPVILAAALSLATAIGSLVYLLAGKTARGTILARRKPILACLLAPGLVFLLLFFSLAAHMHGALGGWPEHLGDQGFPPALKQHADVAGWYFSGFLLFALFAWPVLVAVCFAVGKFRRYVPHVVALGVSFWLACPWMFAAPARFLYWWWD